MRLHQEDDLHKSWKVSSGQASTRPATGKAPMHLLVSDLPPLLWCCHEVKTSGLLRSVLLRLVSFCASSLTSLTDVLTSCCNTGRFFLGTVSSCAPWRFCHLPAPKPTSAPPHSHGKWRLRSWNRSVTEQQDFTLHTSWQDPAVSCYQVTGMTRGDKGS